MKLEEAERIADLLIKRQAISDYIGERRKQGMRIPLALSRAEIEVSDAIYKALN